MELCLENEWAPFHDIIYLKFSKNDTTKVAHLDTMVRRDKILIAISLKSIKI